MIQNKKYSQDSVRNYLQTIGGVPLLRGEEEIELSRQVTDLLQLERIRQQLAEKLGRQPSDREWAQEVNMMLPAFRRRLYFDRRAKNKIIQANLRLVVFIAKKYLKRGLSLQDLIQEGNLGLIKAVEKFEPEKGCKFSTYAYWWIRQSIMRAIAEQSRTIRLPIHIHDKLSLIKKTFKHLSEKLQRQPNEVEMAECLNMTVERLRFLLKVAQVPFSLEVPVDREEDSRLLSEGIESDIPTPEEWIVKELRREKVKNILSYLSSQERDILRLRFGLDDGVVKTPEEISQILNLSRKEIHKIRGKAINKLRRLCLGSDLEEYLF
ncbi:sigma-70 family RNA polymerase sigma factor [Pleurocapsales cyanobacterium LEGE 06147]|nr:sigma-70 family RNA polymerase sigma factor [Pleurocapsales cyanobacterium LEGE 06147]